jgi:hypothetical protein
MGTQAKIQYYKVMNIGTKLRSNIYNVLIKYLLNLLKFVRGKRRIANNVIEKSWPVDLDKILKYSKKDFSIIIVTFEARFFEFALPLITTIRSVSSDPIFVVINGSFTKKLNVTNLQKFLYEIVKFENIYPTVFSNFRGCAELWNTGIINSDSKYNLILNDDIHIFPHHFNSLVVELCSLLDEHHLVTINRSFGHFGISKKCIEAVGFFDEHFLGISEEDRDYVYRYESKFRKLPPSLASETFLNISDDSRDEMIRSMGGNKFTKKYSFFNHEVYKDLYEVDQNSELRGVYDLPMKRRSEFINPRPLWKFRKDNYGNLSN